MPKLCDGDKQREDKCDRHRSHCSLCSAIRNIRLQHNIVAKSPGAYSSLLAPPGSGVPDF